MTFNLISSILAQSFQHQEIMSDESNNLFFKIVGTIGSEIRTLFADGEQSFHGLEVPINKKKN